VIDRLAPSDSLLSAEDFRLLRESVSARMGLALAPGARPGLERRLRERLAVLNLKTFAEYYQYLSFDPGAADEWDALYDLLTTTETYFFREDYQLRAFQNEVLPELIDRARPRRRLTIWSAGCSTGEEVYTIAMLIHEMNLVQGWEVRVFGSDISKRCIATARRGVYGPSSFRVTPKDKRRAYFIDRPDPQARKSVIDLFHERLYPSGVLLLGHSESLLNVSTAFELLHLKEDLVYRKPKSF